MNTGGTADTLTSVTSPVAGEVTVTGSNELPGGFRIAVGTPGAEVGSATPSSSAAASQTSAPPSSSTSGAPSTTAPSTSATPPSTSAAADPIGTMQIVLKAVNTELSTGKNVPVTFVFAKAGPITVEVPIAAPNDPRKEAEHEHGEGGH
ncbi:hypothetical protein ACOBQX_18975 [Actinokineospora sp. G85]|uniref:hypothetical protein n=1 Tax=Actinokineospora sp. G85 TaxID=3406626 RepID=UPI003C72E97E